MAFDLKRFVASFFDVGAEVYEERTKELIVFGALIVLALIVVWKRS